MKKETEKISNYLSLHEKKYDFTYVCKLLSALFCLIILLTVGVFISSGYVQIIFAILVLIGAFIYRLISLNFCRCPSCGMPVALIKKSCTYCGTVLRDIAIDTEHSPKPKINISLYAVVSTIMSLAVLYISHRYAGSYSPLITIIFIMLCDRLFFYFNFKEQNP